MSNDFLKKLYLPMSGPRKFIKIVCKVPKEYIKEPINTKSAMMTIKVCVPPTPKIFSANPTSPIKSLICPRHLSITTIIANPKIGRKIRIIAK